VATKAGKGRSPTPSAPTTRPRCWPPARGTPGGTFTADIYRIQVQPGEPRLSEPHMPGTTEHVVISTGRALIGPARQPTDLSPGDYVRYPGDTPHIFRALEPDTIAVMIMEHI